MAERITSRANPLMTHIRKLASSRSYRAKSGEYLGDGTKLLEEALTWGAAVTTLVYTAAVQLPPLPPEIRAVEVPEDVMKSISPMEAPQGALFLAKQPDTALPEKLSGSRYLVLEGVQDPGNVGTILRTADAFEADGLILLEGCADLYNPKTVRASMGAVFRRSAWSGTLAELLPLLKAAQLPLLGAALRDDTTDVREVDLTRAAMLIGSEGRGLSEAALAACDGTIRIPMGVRCESLNAAVAAATPVGGIPTVRARQIMPGGLRLVGRRRRNGFSEILAVADESGRTDHSAATFTAGPLRPAGQGLLR